MCNKSSTGFYFLFREFKDYRIKGNLDARMRLFTSQIGDAALFQKGLSDNNHKFKEYRFLYFGSTKKKEDQAPL